MNAFVARRRWLDEEALRLDATAYAGGGPAIRDRIVTGPREWKPLGKVAELFNGPRFVRHYIRDCAVGTPLLSSSDILLADLGQVPLVSNTATPGLDRLIVHEGWTLISCSGTIGNTAFVRPEMAGMAASQHVMRAVPSDYDVAPGYLFALLSSSLGQTLIKRRTYGSIVQHIEPHHIADLPVLVPPPEFQQRIHDLVTGAARARTEASRLLDEASGYFDGLAGPMPSAHDHAYATGTVRRSRLNLRLDAFHHVGWATEPIAASGDRIDQLADVISTNRVPRIYVKQGLPFLSGIDVFRIRPAVRVQIAPFVADQFQARVARGDLAIQGSAQRYGLLGRAAFLGQRLHGWAASHDLFRVRTGSIASTARIYAYLRSESGHRAMLRHSYGTSIPHVNPVGIAALAIPSIPEQYASGATRAIELREQADADEQRAIDEVEAWLA